jgi:hypothetical protein
MTTLKMAAVLREQMAQSLRDFIEQHPEEPLYEEYPNPAKEFRVHVASLSIAIFHESIPTVFLT